jgi:SSS family solute:Na+ symporter
MFWKRANGLAALVAALATLPLGLAFNEWLPTIPFLHRMGYVFLILVGLMVVISLLKSKKPGEGEIEVQKDMFKVTGSFGVGVLFVGGILAALYIVFW